MDSFENNSQLNSRGQSGVGPLLRAARERVGSELTEISLALRIRRPYLEAIEEDRYEDLPGATYTVGFIRSYAEHLGLDADEVVRRYKNQHISSRDKQKLIFPVPISENRIPGFFTILVGAVFVFFAYSIWHVSTVNNSFLPDSVAVIPQHFSELIGGSKRIEKINTGSAVEKTAIIYKDPKTLVKSKSSHMQLSESKEFKVEKSEKIPIDKQSQKEKLTLNEKNKKASNSSNSGFSNLSNTQGPNQVKEKNVEETGRTPLTSQSLRAEGKNKAGRSKKLPRLENTNSGLERTPEKVKSISEVTNKEQVSSGNNSLIERVVVGSSSNEQFKRKVNQPNFSGDPDLRAEESNFSVSLETEITADRELNSNVPVKVIPEEKTQSKVEKELGLESAQNLDPKTKDSGVAVFETPSTFEGDNITSSRGLQDVRDQMPVGSNLSSLNIEGALIENKKNKSSEKEVEVTNLKKDAGMMGGGSSREKTKQSKSLDTGESSASAILGTPTKKQDLIESLPEAPTDQSNSSDNKSSKTQQKTNNEVVSLFDQGAEDSGLEENLSERVEIVATGNSWIQIRDDLNNKMLMTRLMQIGDRYKVPEQEGLQLLTGNAGALDIFVNGVKAPSIGGDGVVRRRVILEGPRLREGTAVDD